MANDCAGQLQVCATRVVRLEDDGSPDVGANNMYVSDALATMTVTPVYTEGAEIVEPNACGSNLIDFTAPPELRRADFELTLVIEDPQLVEMLSGGTVLTSGAAVGWAMPPVGELDVQPVSIEVWVKRIIDGVQHATLPWARWLFPWADNLRVGAKTFANGVVRPVISGQLHENDQWLDGPLNDWLVASDRVFQWLPVSSIPTTACGYATVTSS